MDYKLVWLTGFGPFEGAPVNNSWVAVRHMPRRCVRKHRAMVKKERVPVRYGVIDRRVPAAWRALQPAVSARSASLLQLVLQCFM